MLHIIFTHQSRGEALFSAGKWRSPILSLIIIHQTLQNTQGFYLLHIISTHQSRGVALFSAGKWRSPILSLIIIHQTLQNIFTYTHKIPWDFICYTLYPPTNLAPHTHQNILKKKTFAPSPTGGNNSKQKEREVGTLHCFYYSILYTLPSSYQLINHSYYSKYPQKKKLLHLALPGETILNKKREISRNSTMVLLFYTLHVIIIF